MGLGKPLVPAAGRLGLFRAARAYFRGPARRELAGAARSDTRRMATTIPSKGWGRYNQLSPKGKSLVRALEKDRVVALKPGEVGTKHLAELTRYFDREVAVIQGPRGNMKILPGEVTSTRVPSELLRRGYRFTVHTHPEDRIPGELTELDRVRGLRSSMEYDLTARMRGTETHVEAVVNRQGDVTYFDHTGILPAPNGPVPGAPINHLGFVVPVPGL